MHHVDQILHLTEEVRDLLRRQAALDIFCCADPDVKLDIRMQTFWDVSIDPYVKVEVTATVPANPSSEKRSLNSFSLYHIFAIMTITMAEDF